MAKTKEDPRPCATEGCENPAKLRFERDGVGSDYCPECYAKIDLDAPPAPDALTVLDQSLDGQNLPEGEGATGADTPEGEPSEDTGPTEAEKLAFLESVLNQIGMSTANGTVPDDLRAHLTENGLASTDTESGAVTVSILGVTAGSEFGLHRALLDWCMAASRAIMAGRAVE